MEKGFPIEVVQVVPFDEKGSMALGELAKTYEVDHLILAVLSSYEVEAFDRLPLQGSLQGGGPRASIPGYRAENYALAELALLDVSRGRVLVQADWGSLGVIGALKCATRIKRVPCCETRSVSGAYLF